MPLHSRMPAHLRRAPAVSPRPGPLAALGHTFLLVAVVLCTLAHGPLDEPHRSSAPTLPAAVAFPAAPEAPHGPHGHHSAEECLPGGIPRTPTAQTSHQPPSAAVPVPLLAGIATAALGPLRPGRRRPHRRRRSRTGRTVLVRTSRWRV